MPHIARASPPPGAPTSSSALPLKERRRPRPHFLPANPRESPRIKKQVFRVQFSASRHSHPSAPIRGQKIAPVFVMWARRATLLETAHQRLNLGTPRRGVPTHHSRPSLSFAGKKSFRFPPSNFRFFFPSASRRLCARSLFWSPGRFPYSPLPFQNYRLTILSSDCNKFVKCFKGSYKKLLSVSRRRFP